ncbi:pilus assembly protein [Ralstonia soli]|uniref:PilC/PilY family type IV pilus protein n=1 Tax=Ralstonia soli TaxID=2953896 RepID=A0ABT1AJ63_9RALS|nr:PilC/PilY family type IV pilus protein [Ralstonia soli]MCO5398438.1 PilC/PilY family type IV pilus protein [Ralstonia soli]
MNNRSLRAKALALLLSALLPLTTNAALLTIAQYPLFLSNSATPNVLVVYDNSQSMDGTMAGQLIAGSDPSTRGNIARSVITSTMSSYRTQFNWGLATFNVQSPVLKNTFAYYFGTDKTMVFTKDCVNGISASNNGLRCIPNPQSSKAYPYITYELSGDDSSINDVLYTSSWPYPWGIGQNAKGNKPTTSYYACSSHDDVGTWTYPDDFSRCTSASFTPTDAGFLPSNPPYSRMIWLPRAWGYNADVTGDGQIVEAVQADSASHFQNLMDYLAPETNSASAASGHSQLEIKNSAVYTPLSGSLQTAKSYFGGSQSGYSTPVSQTCQKNFVLLATDGNPTGKTDGSMWAMSDQQSTYNANTGQWTFSKAANDVFSQVTALRSTSIKGYGSPFDIQTYVVGMGSTVANPASVAVLNQMAKLGGTGNAYLASDSATLQQSFQSIAADITSKVAAASAVSLNAGSWGTGTALYQAKFSSGDWSGQLLAYAINADGSLGSQLWDAGKQINAQNWDTGRQILTYKPSAALGARGIPFRWPVVPASPTSTELDAAQSTKLNYNANQTTNDGYGAQRVSYLRGNTANEANTCPSCTPSFRNRPTSRLGDIVHSSPNYVGAPAFNYPDNFESASYSAFASTWSKRTPMIYVGANDGMLHAINATTGNEVMGYVPAAVYSNLSTLTAPAYSHQYFVDGAITVGDAFYKSAWHTMLAGALAAGGQGIFALDVTDPSKFSESTASQIARWEFTDANDADMGYSFGQPLIVKTNNGRWSVIVANGYNSTQGDGAASTTGHAVLFVLDAETGAITAKIDTKAGTTSSPNGLSGPIAVDTNGDGIADVVYAGDLAGNMWKFDLSSTTVSNWSVAYGTSASPQPLFSTGGQPITMRPDVTKNQQGNYLVVFGTGQYLATNDNATTAGQTFYGIIDKGAAVGGVSSLQQQSVLGTATGTDGNTYRISTHAVGKATLDAPETGDNAISLGSYNSTKLGWYINLPTSGERAVTDATIRSGRVIFNTVIPSNAVCSAGGTGWVMELDVFTGNRLDNPTFDTNGDRVINNSDLLQFNGASANTSGRQVGSIPAAPGFLQPIQPPGATPFENKYVNTSAGAIQVMGETAGKGSRGRVAWRQLN